jgi:transcriptional regulator with XRE-family HTH domain
VILGQAQSTVFAIGPYTRRRNRIVLFALSDGMKARTLPGFGPQLAQIRKARGLTQTELGQKLGVSQRVVAYYEQADGQPPGPLLLDLAQALQVSTDELLGRRPLKTPPPSPKTARLLKRLQQVEALPRADQQAVLKFVDALMTSRGRAGRNGGRRRAPA